MKFVKWWALSIAALVFVSQNLYAQQIYQTRRFARIVTPYGLLPFAEKKKAISDATRIFTEEMTKILPQNEVTAEAITALKENDEKIQTLIDDLNAYIQDSDEGMFHYTKAVPTGFMVYVGGKLEVNLVVGSGVSGYLTLICVPSGVTKIHKVTKVVSKQVVFDCSVAVLPIGNVGAGAGAGGGVKVGAGLIWGSLHKSGDFTGAIAGVSGTISLAFGNEAKFGFLFNKKGVRNTFVMAGLDIGAQAVASISGNIGGFITIHEFIRKTEETAGGIWGTTGGGGGWTDPWSDGNNDPLGGKDPWSLDNEESETGEENNGQKPVEENNNNNGSVDPWAETTPLGDISPVADGL